MNRTFLAVVVLILVCSSRCWAVSIAQTVVAAGDAAMFGSFDNDTENISVIQRVPYGSRYWHGVGGCKCHWAIVKLARCGCNSAGTPLGR